ncbi:MAG TPA: hypothetical protein VFV58_04980 [Blastocatellia bacterium]|jgi:hypothetical protein|nr:hypothetical protein [Blastocatellia bacterium]
MLIQMMCFFLTLIVVGGLASLFVMFDPLAAHRAAFPFAFFFAGLTAFALANIGGLVSAYINDPAGGVITMLVAPTVGLLGGGVFGYRLGLRRRRRSPDNDF